MSTRPLPTAGKTSPSLYASIEWEPICRRNFNAEKDTIAGDFTVFSKSQPEIHDFNAWLGELPQPYKIVIPGNHEFAFEETPRLRRVISNAVFLVPELCAPAACRVRVKA